MSEWWQEPYPGKPMLPVPGFPRPLYPPDVTGYTPSENGPDVIAYKRTVSRLGRWPWQTFDAAFSNAFSHGKSGNVGETGVAGCQRQQNFDQDTGWVGEKMFNFFRSAVIPEPLPNAGQYGMDVTAQNLVAEAFQMFNGKPTPPPPKPPGLLLRQKALNKAISQIGYIEGRGPLGTGNDTKYGQWYGVNYQPWCAIFCTWCFETEGDSSSFVRGSRYAYVPYIVSDASNVRYGLSLTSNPIPGDLVCYDWDGGAYDHVGFFRDGDMSSWKAVEGNTSTRNNSNGGQVMERDRRKSQAARVAFVRVRESIFG